MKSAKADSDVISSGKSTKPTEGKSLEGRKSDVISVTVSEGQKDGKGTPVPIKITPASEPKRISIKFTNGKIDTEALRDENAKEVKGYIKASMADPKIREWCGIGVAEATGLEVKIPPEVAGAALDIIPFAASFALVKQTGLEMRQVYPLVKWDDSDHRILDRQFALLSEKYMPESWKQYSDVGIFCLTILTLFKMKVSAVGDLQKKEFDKIEKTGGPTLISQPAPAPAPAVAEIPKPKPTIVPPPQSNAEPRSLE